jgi:hypothetical protein
MKIAALVLSTAVAISGFAADMTYKGYLADKFCGVAGTGKMDGSDLVNAPGDHTVACQIACASGGYGMMIKDGATYKFTPFDAKGNEMAATILKTTKKTKGPTVTAMGVMKDGVLQVTSLMESEM